MRLVFVTQQVDPAHPALAATVPKLRALAARVDELVVLADGAAEEMELPANCRVKLFRAGSRPARGLRFARALVPELRGEVAVVAHMCPIYAVLAAPLCRPRRIPVVLWFTHWRASGLLRLAERLSSAVTSVDERSFPLSSRKVRGIGHGIDLAEFPCRPELRREGLRLLALGRTSPAKGLSEAIEAVRLAAAGGLDVRLEIRGPSLTPEERTHRAELEALAGERVAIGDSVPRSEVPLLLGEADALVNNMRAGAPDKVVYEAAASCVPVFASNPVFDAFLPESLRFERGRPETLAAGLVAFAGLGAEARAELGRGLRERVAQGHSVDSWADAVLGACRR